MPSKPMEALQSEAWLLRGISSIPGELRLRKGRLSFRAEYFGNAWPFQTRRLERLLGKPGLAASLERGEARVLFEWPLEEVTAWCPWYYFSGGLKLRRAGVTLRLSLGQPANTEVNLASSGTPLALGQAAEHLGEVRRMRHQGKRWLAALAAAKATGPGAG
jgi:hypothetical protein